MMSAPLSIATPVAANSGTGSDPTSQLVQALTAALSSQPETIAKGHALLEKCRQANFGLYLSLLTQIVTADAKYPVPLRLLASISIKNALTSRDSVTRAVYAEQWSTVAPTLRGSIKQGILSQIGCASGPIRAQVCQIVSEMARIELGRDEWKDLVPQLLAHLIKANQSTEVKRSILLILGTLYGLKYTCLDLHTKEVLNCIRLLMDPVHEPNLEVNVSAVTALQQIIEMADQQVAHSDHRKTLFGMIAGALGSKRDDSRMVSIGFDCCVEVAESYPEHLMELMPTVYQVSLQVLSRPTSVDPRRVQHMLTFWLTVVALEAKDRDERQREQDEAEEGEQEDGEEDDQEEDAEEKKSGGVVVVAPSRLTLYVKECCSQVVPAFCQLLTRHELEADDDEGDDDTSTVDEEGGGGWTHVCRLAGAVLEGICQLLRDEACPYLIPVLKTLLNSSPNPDSWKRLDAGLTLLGTMVSGPSPQQTFPLVQTYLPLVAKLFQETKNCVLRATCMWVVGRFGTQYANELYSAFPQYLMPMIQSGLAPPPSPPPATPAMTTTNTSVNSKLVCMTCQTVVSFVTTTTPVANAASTSPYSAALKTIVSWMVQRLQWYQSRPLTSVPNEWNAMVALYETLSTLINHVPKDVYGLMQQVFQFAVSRLSSLHADSKSSSLQHSTEVTALCDLLHSVLLQPWMRAYVQAWPETSMDGFMRTLFGTVIRPAWKTSQETAWAVVGAFAIHAELRFAKYMSTFQSLVKPCLTVTAVTAHTVSSDEVRSRLSLLQDVCVALSSDPKVLIPFCDEWMKLLLNLMLTVPPLFYYELIKHAITTLTTIALITGAEFERYVVMTVTTVQHLLPNLRASDTECDEEDQIEFRTQALLAVVELASAMITQLGKGNKNILGVMNFACQVVTVVLQDMPTLCSDRLVMNTLNMIHESVTWTTDPQRKQIAQSLTQTDSIRQLISLCGVMDHRGLNRAALRLQSLLSEIHPSQKPSSSISTSLASSQTRPIHSLGPMMNPMSLNTMTNKSGATNPLSNNNTFKPLF